MKRKTKKQNNKFKLNTKKTVLRIVAFALVFALNLSSASSVFAYYNDSEDSNTNMFVAGSVDFVLSSPTAGFIETQIASDLEPGETVTREISITNELDSNEFKYNISTVKIDGDADFCDALDLTASLEGSPMYIGKLMDLVVDPLAVIDIDNQDDWLFSVSLPNDASFSLGETCDVKFVFTGSQTRHNLNLGEGFSDVEEISGNIFSAPNKKILITKVYYDPDGEHSGNGAEKKYEWIELYNPTDGDIDLKKWEICDNEDCLSINDNLIIPAYGYALLFHDAEVWKYWEVNEDNVVYDYTLSGNMILANTADMVLLKNPDEENVDQMNWGTPNETTWDNYNNGLWDPGLNPTGVGKLASRIKLSSTPDVFQDTDLPTDWENLSLPSVSLTYPVGGEVWYVGRTYDITWTATNQNGADSELSIDLYYSNDSGSTWGLIIDDTENDGIYTWTVPLFTNGYYVPSHVSRVKVIATGPENFMIQAQDESDDFCPPIDWLLITDEERAMVDELIANGLLDESEVINRDVPVVQTVSAPQNPLEQINEVIEDIIPAPEPEPVIEEETLTEETPAEEPAEEEVLVEEEPAVVEETLIEETTTEEPAETESQPKPTTDEPVEEVPVEEPAPEPELELVIEEIKQEVKVPDEPITEAPVTTDESTPEE